MNNRSLEDVAQKIFGSEDQNSIQHWTQYWRESKERNRRLMEPFQQLVLLDFQDKNILDIGCGTGGLSELVSQQCRHYVGGDSNFHVLQFAPPGSRRSYLQCSANALPFDKHTFDYIFAFDIIEHLSINTNWQIDFLRELHRILRPLGMIFFTTPNRWYPYEGHTHLYFPQYLPISWSNKYIARKNPGFLKEHTSFSNIKLLSPRALRECLAKSNLTFLHDLPCGMDRSQFLRRHPIRGCMAYLGFGWYPHAEFWGILVRSKSRSSLRLKMRNAWKYDHGQPSESPVLDFKNKIDFSLGPFSHQLAAGWHWYEADKKKFRWTRKHAVCYLETQGQNSYVQISGYSPHENYLDIWVDQIWVGEHPVQAKLSFELKYLIPFFRTNEHISTVEIRCRRVFTPKTIGDQRELGVMIFSVGLA